MAKVVSDIDGVLADFTGGLVKWLNAKGHAVKRGKLYTANEFTDYALSKVVPEQHLKAAAHDPTFIYGGIPRFDGAQQFLKDLLEDGHEVSLVTAPWTGPYHTQAREQWIDSLLSFKGGGRIGFQWATPDERIMMPGDILIEDRYETAIKWADTQRACLLMDQPWNRLPRALNVHRYHGYGDIVRALKTWGGVKL